MIKTESILYALAGAFVGMVIAIFSATYAVNQNHSGMMKMMGMHSRPVEQKATDHRTMSMADMSNQLKNKSGDNFDQAFVEMMIEHHEGAVEMAKLIPDRAKHDELKQLSEAIITAQTKEIQDMKQWQKDWGYSGNESMRMMHGEH